MTMLENALSAYDPLTGRLPHGTLVERSLGQLQGCFADELAYLEADPDTPVYSVSSLDQRHGDGDLHLGIGKLMPGRVGDEYFLTRGHLHAWREAAEIYIGLSGKGLLLLEQQGGETQSLTLEARSVVYVPGFTAHRTVNTGDEPLTYLGIYPAKAGHDYAALKDGNFRQVVVDVDGQPTVQSREAYLQTIATRRAGKDTP